VNSKFKPWMALMVSGCLSVINNNEKRILVLPG
jgi:hypothetical protein